jgi:hypothetical protein
MVRSHSTFRSLCGETEPASAKAGDLCDNRPCSVQLTGALASDLPTVAHRIAADRKFTEHLRSSNESRFCEDP